MIFGNTDPRLIGQVQAAVLRRLLYVAGNGADDDQRGYQGLSSTDTRKCLTSVSIAPLVPEYADKLPTAARAASEESRITLLPLHMTGNTAHHPIDARSVRRAQSEMLNKRIKIVIAVQQ
jgi:hypothetical protein